MATHEGFGRNLYCWFVYILEWHIKYAFRAIMLYAGVFFYVQLAHLW